MQKLGISTFGMQNLEIANFGTQNREFSRFDMQNRIKVRDMGTSNLSSTLAELGVPVQRILIVTKN